MNYVFPPNRIRDGVLLLAGTAVLSAIHSWPVTRWQYVDIAAASAEFRQSVLLAGIFAAAVAAWTAGLVASPALASAPAGSVRRGSRLAYSNLTFLWIFGLVGYGVGLAPPAIWALSGSTHGALDLSTILSGFACLAAYIALGYLIGCILPRYIAAPAALCFAYGVVFVTSSILSPIFEFDIVSGQVVPNVIDWLRIGFFVSLAGIASFAAASWLRIRTTVDSKNSLLVLGVAFLPVVCVIYVSSHYPMSLVASDGARADCSRVGWTNVCVHPARSKLLAPLGEGVADLQTSAGRVIFAPVEVHDATLTSRTFDSSQFSIHIQGNDQQWLESALADLASLASGVGACAEMGTIGSESADVSSAVAAWILDGAAVPYGSLVQTPGAQAQFDLLRSMGQAQARQAIERNLDDIRLCESDVVR